MNGVLWLGRRRAVRRLLELPHLLGPLRERHLGPAAAAGQADGHRLPRRPVPAGAGLQHGAQRLAAPDAAAGAAVHALRLLDGLRHPGASCWSSLALAATVLSAILAGRAVALGRARGRGAAPRAATRSRPLLRFFGRRVTAAQIGVVAGLWLFTSYGFMYEIERGNIDLYALFFALLAVWLMVQAAALAVVAGDRARRLDQPQAVSRGAARAALLALSLEGGDPGGRDERRAPAGRAGPGTC